MSSGKKSCETCCSDSIVMVKNGKRKAAFRNEKRHRYRVLKYDGCFVRQQIAADYIVTKEKIGHVIVELKGKDVPHAIKQVFATAESWSGAHRAGMKLAGLIIASCYPKCSTVAQLAQNRFNKKFKGPLHITSSKSEFDFEKVLGG